MTTTPTTEFHHEALLYDGLPDFVERTAAFLREGVERDETALVVVGAQKIELLREAIGSAPDVRFADMATVGRNPARIIPAWRTFVDAVTAEGRTCRGVGEPIWAERSGAELAECELHEALLNVAFDGPPGWRLLCPYDTTSLPADVLAEAQRNHPVVWNGGAAASSATYRGLEDAARPRSDRLPDLGYPRGDRPFAEGDLRAVRAHVRRLAGEAGLSDQRVADATLVADELAANSIRHAGGHGRIRMWCPAGAFVVEVTDRGRIDRPLVGRELPRAAEGGYGLWLANQLAELVQDPGRGRRLHGSRALRRLIEVGLRAGPGTSTTPIQRSGGGRMTEAITIDDHGHHARGGRRVLDPRARPELPSRSRSRHPRALGGLRPGHRVLHPLPRELGSARARRVGALRERAAHARRARHHRRVRDRLRTVDPGELAIGVPAAVRLRGPVGGATSTGAAPSRRTATIGSRRSSMRSPSD